MSLTDHLVALVLVAVGAAASVAGILDLMPGLIEQAHALVDSHSQSAVAIQQLLEAMPAP